MYQITMAYAYWKNNKQDEYAGNFFYYINGNYF